MLNGWEKLWPQKKIEVFSLVEEVVVHLDLRVGFEVIRHQHDGDRDVNELINLQREQSRTNMFTF